MKVIRHATALCSNVVTVLRNPSNSGRRLAATVRYLRERTIGRGSQAPTPFPFGRSSQIWVGPDRGSSRRALLAPMPDFPEMAVWERHLQGGDLFIDVGAHVGFYSVFAAELGAKVIAVEPQPDLAQCIRENLALNRYDGQVLEIALAEQAGIAFLGGGADSSQHALTGGEAGIEVPVETIDAILGERVASGMKIDVEGAERLVVSGAARALRERRIRLIQLEWNACSQRNFGESREVLADLLRSHGFSFFRPDAFGTLQPLSELSLGRDVFAMLQ